ncbi:uncharacterized protein LOC101706784 [Heterocephalus glaber]|uniref:Uncharacterized protein LOC101706784 n=1 Tax=Heterocephalus glaber TaxID=10181 RepID=A0AAX6NTX5_HETGA|nr:uncharacterized protein LOC101706784 [Heterocephalus glaber]
MGGFLGTGFPRLPAPVGTSRAPRPGTLEARPSPPPAAATSALPVRFPETPRFPCGLRFCKKPKPKPRPSGAASRDPAALSRGAVERSGSDLTGPRLQLGRRLAVYWPHGVRSVGAQERLQRAAPCPPRVASFAAAACLGRRGVWRPARGHTACSWRPRTPWPQREAGRPGHPQVSLGPGPQLGSAALPPARSGPAPHLGRSGEVEAGHQGLRPSSPDAPNSSRVGARAPPGGEGTKPGRRGAERPEQGLGRRARPRHLPRPRHPPGGWGA